MANRIAQALAKHGVHKDADVRIVDASDSSGNCLSRATRLYKLGWYEKFGSEQDFLDGIDFDVETILRQQTLLKSGPKEGELVLVTGASGFLGSSIVTHLLRHPARFSVRLAMRQRTQFDAWVDEYPEYADRLDYAQIPSLTETDAFSALRERC